MLFMNFLIIPPINTPGKTNKIWSQTEPSNNPNIIKFDENIKPTVKKNAVIIYGRKE